MPHKWVLAGLTGLLIGAMVVSSVMGSWPDATVMLFGDGGILPFALSCATVAFIVVGAYQAARSLKYSRQSLLQTQTAELATRFQKGVELLGSDKTSAAIGGLAVLADVASEAPLKYVQPVATAMAAYVSERSQEDWRKARDAIVTRRKIDHVMEPTSHEVIQAIILLSHTPNIHRWHKNAFGAAPPFYLSRPYFRDVHFVGVNFRSMYIYDAVLSDAQFIGCDFIEGELHAFAHQFVTFTRCKIINMRIQIHGEDNVLIGSGSRSKIAFWDCTVEGSTLNGLPIESTGML